MLCRAMLWRMPLLVFGVWACATAVIMIKLCRVHPVLLAACRLLVAAVVLAPLFARDLRRCRGRYGLALLRKTVLPGLLLGAHLVTWIIGARLTPAANSSLIVNMVPVAMPFLLYVLVRERLTRGELLATATAMAGVGVLAAADYRVGDTSFLGDVVCFVSMVLLAWYLALGRRNRDFPTIWLYVTPLYLFAGMACLIAALLTAGVWAAPGVRGALQCLGLGDVHPLAVAAASDWMWILALGIIPTVMGHSILNYSMKHLRGQVVSITILGQFIFAGAMAYWILSEIPCWSFYPASVLVVGGAVLVLRFAPGRGGQQVECPGPTGGA